LATKSTTPASKATVRWPGPREDAPSNPLVAGDDDQESWLIARELGLPKLNFQVLRRAMATLAQTKGGVKDVRGIFGTQQGGHHGRRLHATDRGGRKTDARRDLLGADGNGIGSRLVKIFENLVRFGTVGFSGGCK